MIDLETREEVIRLRGLGISYDQISSKTEVSKPSVMKICSDSIDRIKNKQNTIVTNNDESMEFTVKARGNAYKSQLQKIIDELDSRDYSDVSPEKLIGMLERIENILHKPELSSASTNNVIQVIDMGGLSPKS